MPINYANHLRTFFVLALVCVSSTVAAAQTSSTAFNKLLVEKAAFTPDEFLTLNKGEIVVKILKAKEKRQISVFGIVRVQNVPDLDMTRFRESLSQKSNKAMLDGAKFSTPPVLQDIGSLKIDDRDLDDMKTCVVGDCKLKLPTAIINRLQTDVDWNAADHKLQAVSVFKQFLVDYAGDYLIRGDQALIELVDKRKPIRLTDEYRILLDSSVFIRGIAPEFDNYLRKYPGGDLPGVENRLDWSKVGSGLKPIITITHGTAYAKKADDFSSLLIATKQLYASHYIDASLALSSLVRIGADDKAETYLIFTDISSSDPLGGAFSAMAHGVVEGEALERVTDLLQRAKVRIETTSSAQPATVADESGTSSWIADVRRNWVFSLVVFLVLVAIGILVFRRLKR